MDSKDLLSLLKEPLFFDDWAAANFKAINLPPDWLAAQQSPYQILGGDPGAVRQSAEIALSLGWRAGWPRLAESATGEKKSGAEGKETGQLFGCLLATLCRGSGPLPSSPSGRDSHGRGGRPAKRLPAGVSSG